MSSSEPSQNSNGHDASGVTGAREQWERDLLNPAIQKFPERRETFSSSSATQDRIYTPEDVDSGAYLEDLNFPGQYPFTRGVQPTMYRGRLWTMRQYAGFGTAKETNERFKLLIDNGQTGLSAAFDLPTQTGYDSDHPMALGEIGQVGVAIDSLADMEEMFADIPLDKISTSMTINAPAAVLVAMYLVAAEKQGHAYSVITGTAQNDVLKEYVARGTYIFPPKESVRLAANLINFCAQETPRFNSISVSGYHIREAGSTAAQEIGFAFANAIAYLEECQKQGGDLNQVAQRVSWIFNTHNHFFEEVAKFRTLRRLWARTVKNRFDITDPRAQMLRTHTQTGGSTLTAQQPLNNIARSAIQALAAVSGGVQSLALSCYDEALALPTEDAQQIALRTQQIIAHESGAADTIDPFAGSYYIESLTDSLEKEASKIMDHIDDLGGASASIETGYMQTEIQEASVSWQHEVESNERTIVGVNAFIDPSEDATPIFRPNHEVADAQLNRLAELRKNRNSEQVQSALGRLRTDANGQENLMPTIIQAVRSYATLGEICGVLRDEWGEYTPVTVV
jgi:methylmalonyl-CoA mutase N-terminal domain/subunit|tara:strand:- start:1069 stop:2769 length:1701 start_codon:yes stop_codon:yes gene_type:complete